MHEPSDLIHHALTIGATAITLVAAAAFNPAIGAAAATQGTTGTTIDQAKTEANRQKMAECKKLPLSEQDTCADEAGYGKEVTRQSLTPAQHRALAQEDARYKAEVAKCNRLPLNEQTTCISQAGDNEMLTKSK